MKKEMGIFALGAIVAVVLIGGTNALNLRADSIQFTDGSVQTSAAVDTTCDGEPCDGTYISNVTAAAGDSATAFFSTGQIEEPRIDDAIARKAEVAAALGLTTFEFVGTTDPVVADIGVLGMTRACQNEFGAGTRMCTSKEIIGTLNIPAPTAINSLYGWVQPVIVGVDSSKVFDISGGTGWTTLSCDGWSGADRGLSVRFAADGSIEGHLHMRECSVTDTGVACCAPVGS